MIIGTLVLLVVGAYFAWDRGLPFSGPGDGPVKVGVAMTVVGVVGTFLLWWTVVPVVLLVVGLVVLAVSRRRLAVHG